MDRWDALTRADGLDGLVDVGNLILPRAWAAPGAVLPAPYERPAVYAPQRPALLAATGIERPIFEGVLEGWSISVDTPRLDITRWQDVERQYVQPLSAVDVEFRGTMTMPPSGAALRRAVSEGRPLKVYLVSLGAGP